MDVNGARERRQYAAYREGNPGRWKSLRRFHILSERL